MALVLSEKTNRKGEITRFDVVRAEEGKTQEVLKGINPGQYKILGADNKIETFDVSYRTVQDIVSKDSPASYTLG